MAALVTQNVASGGAITVAAASGGGDTLEVGSAPGGWFLSPTFLYATVGATATTITVAGLPFGPFTNKTVVIPVNVGSIRGTRANITYSQVTSVNVGAVQLGPAWP